MKAVFKRIRFSRKFVLIGGAILLLGGASGMAAIFIGKEQLLGPSYASVNGLECKTVQTVNIKKNGSFWVRKFIRTEGGDGTERAKTALRVAKAVYDKEKPDLVQVSLLDSNGPEMRAEMRGRAIAAQAVFISNPEKLPEGTDAQKYSVYYYDGAANTDGMFYGMRIDLPVEDAERLTASLTDFSDCIDPTADVPADAHGGGHKSSGHEAAAPAHGGDHGAEPPKEEGGHPPVTEPATPEHETPDHPQAHGEQVEEQLLTSTPEPEAVSVFSLAYIKSLIFGKGTATAEAGEASAKPVAEEPQAGH